MSKMHGFSEIMENVIPSFACFGGAVEMVVVEGAGVRDRSMRVVS